MRKYRASLTTWDDSFAVRLFLSHSEISQRSCRVVMDSQCLPVIFSSVLQSRYHRFRVIVLSSSCSIRPDFTNGYFENPMRNFCDHLGSILVLASEWFYSWIVFCEMKFFESGSLALGKICRQPQFVDCATQLLDNLLHCPSPERVLPGECCTPRYDEW